MTETREELRQRIGDLAYQVTQEGETERPFTGQYDNFFDKGIYVDIVGGEVLFSSEDKFQAHCGWPAFSQPVDLRELTHHEDNTHGMRRVEVRSRQSQSHLGHVFRDGPAELGGMRYCINSAALRFIPYDQMAAEGYGDYLRLFEPKKSQSLLYFLDGLGSNRYYAADLIAELAHQGIQVVYLPLPGHPDNLTTLVDSPESLIDWLDKVLPTTPAFLLGYSLGGDLAAAYATARPERVAALLLLDGACTDLTVYPEAQELAEAKEYLESQVFGDMAEHLEYVKAESERWSANLERAEVLAYTENQEAGGYHLNLVEEAVLGLLKVRRQFGPVLQAPDFPVPTRVIISDQPAEFLQQKVDFLSTCSPAIAYQVLKDSDHGFCMTKPKSLTELIVTALEELEHGGA